MRRYLMVLLLIIVFLPGCVVRTSGVVPYNKETVATINGNVKAAATVMNKQTMETGLHLTVAAGSDVYTVHVCPEWYAEKHKIQFDTGSLIRITGSTFIKDNEKNIYAARIVDASHNILELRNQDTGETLWTGRTRDESKAQNDQTAQEKKQQEMKAKNQKSDPSFQKMNSGNKGGNKKGRAD